MEQEDEEELEMLEDEQRFQETCNSYVAAIVSYIATPNGDIPNPSRLSMALCWFAGWEPADIFQDHGIHYNEVLTSSWEVVDAINLCRELQLEFPSDHEEQKKIAAGFEELSSVDFKGCVGCIDGMLVWTNKPSKPSLERVGVGPKKFLCGRKKNLG